MKAFRTILIGGWISFFGIVALLFAFPKFVGNILHPVGGWFALLPASMLATTLLYIVTSIYRAGIGKNRKADGAAPETTPPHDA